MVHGVLVEVSDNNICEITVPGYDQGVLDLKGGCSRQTHSSTDSNEGILIDERVQFVDGTGLLDAVVSDASTLAVIKLLCITLETLEDFDLGSEVVSLQAAQNCLFRLNKLVH